MEIRLAREADFDDARRLYVQLDGKLAVPDGSVGEEHWKELLSHAGTHVLVAEKQSDVVAILTLHILPNMTNAARPYAVIENVVTDENEQGQGTGRMLMNDAIERAWSHNAYKIMLMTGKNRQDGGSVGFYEKLGFTSEEKFAMTMRRIPPRD